MSNLDLAMLSFPVLLVLVFLRMPIALAMIGVGVTGTFLVIGTPMMTLNQLKTLTPKPACIAAIEALEQSFDQAAAQHAA